LSFHQRLEDLSRSSDAIRLTTEAEPLRRILEEQAQQTRVTIANLPPETRVDPAFLPMADAIQVTLPAQLDAICELAKLGDWATVRRRLNSELKPIETQTAALVDSINQQARGELTLAAAQMSRVQYTIITIVPLTALSTFCMAAFFGWAIGRRILELRLEERVSERMRIARELHDTLLQSFHGLMLHLEAVNKLLPEGKAKEQLEKTMGTADRAIAEGRSAVYDLRSSTTVTNDLAEAVNAIGNELSSGKDAAFNLIVEGSKRDLHPIIRDEIYRISREGLSNAFKHSGARHIEAEISYGPQAFRLRIRDDGEGIPEEMLAQGRTGHFGLTGIRERAKQIGGELTVWSRPGTGTEIDLSLAATIAYSPSRRKGGDQ